MIKDKKLKNLDKLKKTEKLRVINELSLLDLHAGIVGKTDFVEVLEEDSNFFFKKFTYEGQPTGLLCDGDEYVPVILRVEIKGEFFDKYFLLKIVNGSTVLSSKSGRFEDEKMGFTSWCNNVKQFKTLFELMNYLEYLKLKIRDLGYIKTFVKNIQVMEAC